MFADALERAARYTFPYVGLRRGEDGRVHTFLACFIVVNRDGWIVTSAHVVEEILATQRLAESAGRDGRGRDPEHRAIDRAEIWAVPGFAAIKPRLVGGRVNPASDVATGRLEPFDPAAIAEYPVFRDTEQAPLRQGDALCRLGFPFHTVDASYDEERRSFDVASRSFPVPSFAIEGIIARFNRRSTPSGGSALFIETSSPGLRGQSGGPLLDLEGRVCGIQSHTAHLDLGFDVPVVEPSGARATERQFLNVGLAAHVNEVRSLLDADRVAYLTG